MCKLRSFPVWLSCVLVGRAAAGWLAVSLSRPWPEWVDGGVSELRTFSLIQSPHSTARPPCPAGAACLFCMCTVDPFSWSGWTRRERVTCAAGLLPSHPHTPPQTPHPFTYALVSRCFLNYLPLWLSIQVSGARDRVGWAVSALLHRWQGGSRAVTHSHTHTHTHVLSPMAACGAGGSFVCCLFSHRLLT